MSSLAHVLAEIKSWERDFTSTHGRDPCLQDIKHKPDIAEKYKLYKKLSKASTRLPAPKSRPADAIAPLPGFNPFSPSKKSAKHDHTFQPSTSRPPSTVFHSNPFATPVKNKPNPHPRITTPSPEPPQLNLSPSHVPTDAVSRARKRLRGEPVSPSPKKPKRQRIPSHTLPSTPKLNQDSSNSEHESDQELPQYDVTLSFVADSPAKAPAGGKSFTRLFDDVLPPLINARNPDGLSVKHFNADERSVPMTLKPHHDVKPKGITSRLDPKADHVQGKFSSQIFPSKDNPVASSHCQQVSQSTSTKRALDTSDISPVRPQRLLIPPSPPPQDSINRDTGKGKAKATASRKKMRVEDEESDEGADSSGDITLKVATIRLDRSKHQHADDLEWDPLLYVGARNHDPTATEQIDANRHASGTFTVDLPDKLRRVLAISPHRCQNSTEERVVRELLYGDRVGHYDPFRGGVIWDAGETDEGALGDVEAEDDWEGEPVPWEVGEL